MPMIKPNREREFVEALHATDLTGKGWDIFAIYCQAVLESGYFTSKLCHDGCNCWGIKGNYNGASVEIDTYEFMYIDCHKIEKPDGTIDDIRLRGIASAVYPNGNIFSTEKDGKQYRIRINITDKFKDFPNFSEALLSYTLMIEKNYPLSYQYRGEYRKFYSALLRGREDWRKWSTDSEYPSTLTNLYNKLKEQNDGELYISVIKKG